MTENQANLIETEMQDIIVGLLSNPKTFKNGIELILKREVSEAELNSLTNVNFVGEKTPEEYYNELMALQDTIQSES